MELSFSDIEGIRKFALTILYPFRNSPYKVRDDDAMRDMAESVKQYGVLSPAIARPLPGGGVRACIRPQAQAGLRAGWAGDHAGSSSESWTTTRRRSSSWTAICSVKGCSRARERLRTGSSLRQCSIKGKGKI